MPLSSVLHDVRAFIHRYLRVTSEQATLLTVWVAMTHALDAFDYAAYIHITSPLPECGKSRCLEVLESLVARPWMTARVTAAVLMRKLDKEHPTLLLDETDAAFNGDEQYSEALRGMLNAGFHREGRATVCVGNGTNIYYKDFSVFGAKCVAGIGQLPSTVESRSIPIEMKRRTKREELQKWRRRAAWMQADALRTRLAELMAEHLEPLRQARPAMPDGLSDRAEDVLEPLFAISDLAGDEWPAPVRAAAVTLMGVDARAARAADQNLPLELLSDIRPILDDDDTDPDFIATKTLTDGLKLLDERPWVTFGKSEKGITPHALARLLKRFDIRPAGKVRVAGGSPVAAYRRDAFVDAFLRYLGFEVEHRNNANESGPEAAKIRSEQTDFVPIRKTAVHPDKHWVCSDVPLQNPDHREDRGLPLDFVPPRGISRTAWVRHHMEKPS